MTLFTKQWYEYTDTWAVLDWMKIISISDTLHLLDNKWWVWGFKDKWKHEAMEAVFGKWVYAEKIIEEDEVDRFHRNEEANNVNEIRDFNNSHYN